MENGSRCFQRIIAFVIGFLALSLTLVQGQNSQGTILGHVQDSTGAALPGVKITATNVNTNVSNHFTTNSTGDYVLVDMIPGTYQVKAEAEGFKAAVSGNLILEVDQTLRQNFALEIGQVKEVMTVTADAQMVQTDNTTTGNVLDQKTIEELPSSGRDFNNLLNLSAGASNVSGGSQVYWALHGLNNSFTEVSVNGARPDSVSFLVDGVADTDALFSTASNIPSESSIQEVKVQTGLYSAEYGQGSGQINVAIKSGTNKWHGEAYDYFQNDALNPRSPLSEEQHLFESGAAPRNTPFKQNQFGGTLGGPVRIPWLYNGQDRTFWFFAYDGGRQHITPQNQNAIQVPTQQERSGNFSDWPYQLYDPSTTQCSPSCDATTRTAFQNNQLTNMNPTGQKLASLFPLPNISCTMPCPNYLNPVHKNIQTDNETMRVDQNFGDKDRIYFTGHIRNDYEPNPSMLPYSGSTSFTTGQLFGLNWEHAFSGTTINTGRFGYNHQQFSNNPQTAYGPNLQAELGFVNSPVAPALYGIPQMNLNDSYSNIGNGSFGTSTKHTSFQLVDNLKLIRGKHSLTFGTDIRLLREFEQDNYLGIGSLTFNGEYTANCNATASGCVPGSPGAGFGNPIADLLLSDPSNLSAPYPLGVDYLHVEGINWNFFAQDDIRVTPRLTVNLGLRYELPPNYHSNDNSGWNVNFANGGSLNWVSRNFVNSVTNAAQAEGLTPYAPYLNCCAPNTLVPIDKKDFAPRIGISWRPFPTDRFVVRAGYGIFYDTYMRYYDMVQNFDSNALQTEFPNTGYVVGNGTEQASPLPALNHLWLPNVTGAQFFSTTQPWYSPGFSSPILNQVAWPFNHNPYNQQWTLDTQYAVTRTLLLDIGYVGSHGLRLPTQLLYNTAFPANVPSDSCNFLFDVSQATGTNASCATDPNFQPVDTRVPLRNLPSIVYANANVLNANYNSLQVQLRQRFDHGLSYNIAYTWSRAFDETSGINNVVGNNGFIQDPHHIQADYGPANFDEPSRLTASGSWELPVGRGKRWSLGYLNPVLGGWKASGIYTINSGRVFTAYGYAGPGYDEMGAPFSSRYRLDQSGSAGSGFTRAYTEWFNTGVFTTAPQGLYGTEPKGILRGPYYADLDLSFAKWFAITERQRIQARFEMFNAGSNWHHGAWFPCSSFGNCGSTPFGSLVPQQSSADAISASEWAHDNLWQSHTIQLSLVYSF